VALSRINLGSKGHLEFDGLDFVTVGDRRVPRSITAHLYGQGVTPDLEIQIDVVEGVPRCESLTLRRSAGGQEIRSKDLRAVRIEDWVNQFVAECSDPFEVQGSTIIATHHARSATTADIRNAERARKRRPARKIEREFLERVATIYRDHFDDRPIIAIEKAFGVERRTASWYVQLCRSDEHQLLPKTSGGKKKA